MPAALMYRLFFPQYSQYKHVKSLAVGQNLSVMSLCNSFISPSLLQHMLSPQKAPERLLQLADSNLESLVIEMDQLHSRVHTIHPFFSISAIFCHLLSFYPVFTLFFSNITSWREKRLCNRMRSEFLTTPIESSKEY